ncbi:NACHT domain-containing protein [Streptomyces caniscabiei]|uniref:NACHT domain-containing protein n=1 Tax=Streptomyces caniscabiei TaxID=2746961 RepID=UPI0029B969B9|nr:NACHT domain-containing protein [Streptomyces caniscabiei]MDX2605744.1 NACHT domain-containing protein [Streptomyces caniscabiei]MDX2778336.1 NACHT domain-containing protein [Streptomyces caniscabiei]
MNVGRRPSGRLTRQGHARARPWRVRKSGWYYLSLVATLLGALLLLFLAVTALVTLANDQTFWTPVRWIDQHCEKSSNACTVLQSLIMPFLTLSLATVAYLSFRFTRVRRAYLRKARTTPHELVETAGGILGEVVGRDQLCEVLMEDQRDARFRRTHVVVGGVGTGKTALIVLLTEQFARRKALPVPLRLRNADTDLDFREMAFRRFCREVQGYIRSDAEAEKVWRRLCQQGRIVVLADGLEEALTGDTMAEERDTVIRLAIRRATEERLPLIITSRPHDSLRGMEASLTDLEPLSEEAALAYISSGSAWEDRQRLDWIVEKAGIAEAPTYLQIAGELHEEGLLERALNASAEEEAVETRGGDRAGLRHHLVDTWIAALISGRFRPELPLGQDERRAAVHYLSALACAGLASDSCEVHFTDVVDEQNPSRPRYPEILAELVRRVEDSKLDIRLAAHWGARMGLVEVGGDRVRFQHSVIQAHLGARFMNAVIHPGVPAEPTEGHLFPAALEKPGRELLIAMVLHSRTPEGSCRHGEEAQGDGQPWCPVSAARDLLVQAACKAQMNSREQASRPGSPPARPAGADGRTAHESTRDTPDRSTGAEERTRASGERPAEAQEPAQQLSGRHTLDAQRLCGRTLHAKALELYAAALEIDSVDAEPQQHLIAMRLATSWPDLRARDPHTLRVAKALLVSRFGDAMRGVARSRTMIPAYLELFEIARLEPSYPIRVAIAQEIGAGGDSAFAVLQARLRGPETDRDEMLERGRDWMVDLWGAQEPDADTDAQAERRGHRPAERDGSRGPWAARERERRREERRQEESEREEEEQRWRDNTMCAWLIPLLVGSVTTQRHQNTPYEYLESWVRRVGAPDGSDAPALDLTVEIALAQGFKYAANRRHRHPHARAEAREYLSGQAWDMLKRTRFWFTRLTLLHALTLWDLPDGVTVTRPAHGRGSHPAEQVRQWLALPDGKEQHPFVEEAARLCVRALETRQPERFLWIDESGVAAHVGSQTAPRGEVRKHQLWIPPSTGWSTLHPRAQQLLADVLLLLNLAERGDWPKDRLRRLRHTARPDLPPCLSRDRGPLDPGRTVVRTTTSQAGSNCRDDCSFELCPYPPKGLDSHRVELSEAFCRAQSGVLSRSFLHPQAPWQQRTDVAELRRFWERMGQRAQDNTRPR